MGASCYATRCIARSDGNDDNRPAARTRLWCDDPTEGGRMRDGSHQEYVDYVTARIPALRRLAFLLAGDEHRADDLVQQTITTPYVKWKRASAADHLDAYVRTMLVRTYVDE